MTDHETPHHPEFEVRYDIDDHSRIATSVLQTLPWAGGATSAELEATEFTSVCPWSGLPDFATIRIEYSPNTTLVEQKSLKYYLLSFRNVGILQEEVVDRIFRDLDELLNPWWLTVQGIFTSRGGIGVTVIRSDREEPTAT